MRFLINWIVKYKGVNLLLVLLLCFSVETGAQHKKSTKKKSSHESSSHKRTGSKHGSSSHSKKKTKSKASSSSRKSKKSTSVGERSKSRKKNKRSKRNPVFDSGDEASAQKAFVYVEPITDNSDLRKTFITPPELAKPWVFWYWTQAAVSREGIIADLEAMKEAGIGGAYLMRVKGPAMLPSMSPPLQQLTPQWWQMVKFAMTEAKRLGLKLAMNDYDDFAVAGGPWISPEQSMQRVTWSKTLITGGKRFNDTLATPKNNENYYRDIAVFAYPVNLGDTVSTETIKPLITNSRPGTDASFLTIKGNKKIFSSDTTCWIQYTFLQPFTCRSVSIRTNNNFQAQRLSIQISDDGQNFHEATRLESAYSGGLVSDEQNTYAINPVTARYYRFVYDQNGTEPSIEDLKSARWKPYLRVQGIELSGAASINQYQGKSGEIYCIAKRTTTQQVPDALCIPKDKLLNITKYIDASGCLNWDAPAGKWIILRMGHTSTGQTNQTGGAGKRLECDKFNPEVVKFQFDNWYVEAIKQAGPELTAEVLKIFHVDNWECGSQNWSPVFQGEFNKRRGYDLLPYLPVMAGIPLQSAELSEKVLHDVRQTIAELLVDNFFGTMAKLAHEKGMAFSAEATAPTIVGDGMLHYRETDIPMGEFWLRSPTYDEPGNMLDAISGGHIYGKNLIQAKAFTEARTAWDEYPGNIKALGDRNMALGANRFVLNGFDHNAWFNRKPGITLDGVGLCFQRDQTWWKPGFAWVQYLQRCQAMLQMGKPVIDVAVFTGEELPRRAILPNALVATLPGLFGSEVVASEIKRLNNTGQLLHTISNGISSSANMGEPQKWVDPLRGYAYDSFNRDALLRLATVRDGRIVLPGGASYGILVMPGALKASPNDGEAMSPEVSAKIQQLIGDGATIILNNIKPATTTGLTTVKLTDFSNASGKGKLIRGPYEPENFDAIGLQRDVIAIDSTGGHVKDIAWTHRTDPDFDIYFFSNQQNTQRVINFSVRVADKIPEMWDPMTGETYQCSEFTNDNGRTNFSLRLEPSGSFFIVLRKPGNGKSRSGQNWTNFKSIRSVDGIWQVKFDPKSGGPEESVLFTELTSWSRNEIPAIKYYSGTADYLQTVKWNSNLAGHKKVWLDLGKVDNIASVTINGVFCGVAWSPPYRVDISKALRTGYNKVHVEVTNTWANRLIGDHTLPGDKRITNTTAPFSLESKPLLPAGLLGPVKIVEVDKNSGDAENDVEPEVHYSRHKHSIHAKHKARTKQKRDKHIKVSKKKGKHH